MANETVPAPLNCPKCEKSFSGKKNLNAHCRKFHPEINIPIRTNRICGLCNETFRVISRLHNHIQSFHSISLKFTNETFKSEEEFLNWKRDIENRSQSFYKITSRVIKVRKKLSYYVCHRSGRFKPKEAERKRHMKASGSIKIGSTCPSVIQVSEENIDGNMHVKVRYQSVHVGHALEPTKLRLSKEEKTKLASSLELGIPITKIIEKTKQNLSASKRYSLITRKDLHNISQQFNIPIKTALDPDDITSVNILVQKLRNEPDNPILFHKAVGEVLKDCPTIHKNEFLLGIMNQAQKKLLEIYGGTCLMIDSTHGTTQFGLEMTTIMVHDERHQVLPVATLFSSETSTDTFWPFLKNLKQQLPNFLTKAIMTGDSNSFVNAWESVFKIKPIHLLCTSQVIRNINFHIHSKVSSCNKKKIKKAILDMLTETDETIFKCLVQNFIEEFNEEESAFIKYFESIYCNRVEKWAYCYRKDSGIDIKMKLERWHLQFKTEENGGIVAKHFDKAISIVLMAITKKLLDRVITMERGKLTDRMFQIHEMHAISSEIKGEYSVVQLNENKFAIRKEVGSQTSTNDIEIVMNSPCCLIKCDHCNVCIHSMTCTCIDYSVKLLICKHMHLICQKTHEDNYMPENIDNSSVDNLIIHIAEQQEKQTVEKNAIVPNLQNTELNTRKRRIVQRLKELKSTVEKWDSLDPLSDVEKKIEESIASFQIATSRKQKELANILKSPQNQCLKIQRKY